MNERNVAALRDIIEDFDGPSGYLTRAPSIVRDLVEFLASRGVLVPSVLTEEEAKTLTDPLAYQYIAGWFSTKLERIAKGEP